MFVQLARCAHAHKVHYKFSRGSQTSSCLFNFQLNKNLLTCRHELDIVRESVTPFLCLFNSEVNLRMRTIELYTGIVSVNAMPYSCSFNSFLVFTAGSGSVVRRRHRNLFVILVSYLISRSEKNTNTV
jgi:hypothetical protein